ncbi:glutathione binding-like protein [Sphingobium sp.]|uniref:glutathione binding-like protein n=1 Tax=Sphingobium sp. TaxID=1912891 RepID=UPI002CC5EBD4|nr:glutathione binding-like protein [Sphingobium sp.]HUD94761.1 glutathione binding-like protein [Sphingobium sp.]
MFESGAIVHYLAEKTGQLLPEDPRGRTEAVQWVFWQMGGLGPMAGQNHHFRYAAPRQLSYAIARYTNETNRLYGVLDKRLADREYLAGPDYSIADVASYPWVVLWQRQGQSMDQFPHVQHWLETIRARPAVARACAPVAEVNPNADAPQSEEARRILYGETAEVVSGR